MTNGVALLLESSRLLDSVPGLLACMIERLPAEEQRRTSRELLRHFLSEYNEKLAAFYFRRSSAITHAELQSSAQCYLVLRAMPDFADMTQGVWAPFVDIHHGNKETSSL